MKIAKKLLTTFACFVLVLVGGVLLTACGEESETLNYVQEKAATCTENGNIAYWQGEESGKYFSDEEGKNEITLEDTIVATLGHDYVYTYNEEELIYEGVCSHDETHTIVIDAGTSSEFAYLVADADSFNTFLNLDADGVLYIKLTASFAADIVIPEDKEVQLDINGQTLTNVTSHTITNNGKLIICDTSDEPGTIDNTTHARAALLNNQGAYIDFNDVTVTRSAEAGIDKNNNGGNSYYTIQNYGRIIVNSGTVLNNGKFSSMFANGWYDGTQNTSQVEAELIINGGTFEGGLNTIKNDDWGVTIINDGTFINFFQACVFNVNDLTFNGGYVDGSQAEQAFYTRWYDDTMDKGITTINGGTIIGKLTRYNEKAKYVFGESLDPNAYEIV